METKRLSSEEIWIAKTVRQSAGQVGEAGWRRWRLRVPGMEGIKLRR
jgi:hypothetical protein